MLRRETLFAPEHYDHLYNRGNNRQAVFYDESNYLYFLCGVKKYLLDTMAVIAYCLMPTHYHLLVRVKAALQTSEVLETSEVSEVSVVCSRALQKFLISYTKAINKRYDRVGALFQGQVKAERIQNSRHLAALCIYIHANPIKDGLVVTPADWPYSNFREWMGTRQGTLVDRALIAELFESPQAYQALVPDHIESRKVSEDIKAHLLALQSQQ